MLGFAEQLEFLQTIDPAELTRLGKIENKGSDHLYEAAVATCDFYIDHAAAADGVPYWDTGAPGLAALMMGGARRSATI